MRYIDIEIDTQYFKTIEIRIGAEESIVPKMHDIRRLASNNIGPIFSKDTGEYYDGQPYVALTLDLEQCKNRPIARCFKMARRLRDEGETVCVIVNRVIQPF